LDIEIIAYRSDMAEVNSWYAHVDPGIRGQIGLVAHRAGEMIASGFLVPTYANFCIWDFVESSPKASSFSRAKALILLAKTAERWARDQGFKSLVGWIPPHRKDLDRIYKKLHAEVSTDTYRSVIRRL